MSRPPFEVADLVRTAGSGLIERNRAWIRWTRGFASCGHNDPNRPSSVSLGFHRTSVIFIDRYTISVIEKRDG